MTSFRAALILLSATAAAPGSALVCPRTAGPEIQLVESSEAVAIDRSKGIAELTFLRRPGPGLHSNGLYTSSLQHQLELRFAIHTDRRDACISIDLVRAEVGFRSRTIHIARDYGVGTCEAGAILDHERKHVATDERLLHQELPQLRSGLDRMARSFAVAPVPLARVEQVQERMKADLNGELQRLIEAFHKRRDAAQAAIDAPAEYERVRRLCPGGWQ
jgi:hypothetical protein